MNDDPSELLNKEHSVEIDKATQEKSLSPLGEHPPCENNSPNESYSVRLRAHTSGDLINSAEAKIEFLLEDQIVVLKSIDKEPLNQSTSLILLAQGFGSEEEAQKFGGLLANAIGLAGVHSGFGFDLGKDRPSTTFTEYGLATLSDEQSRPVLNDRHGILVYKESSFAPIFASASLNAVVARDVEHFRTALGDSFCLARSLTPKQLLAIEIYNASFFEAFPKSRFLSLITVVECLADDLESTNTIKAVVDHLIATVKISYLTREEMDPLIQRLHQLKIESIGKTCKRYVTELLGADQARDFKDWYGIRSKLVHEGTSDYEIRDLVPRVVAFIKLLILAEVNHNQAQSGRNQIN